MDEKKSDLRVEMEKEKAKLSPSAFKHLTTQDFRDFVGGQDQRKGWRRRELNDFDLALRLTPKNLERLQYTFANNAIAKAEWDKAAFEGDDVFNALARVVWALRVANVELINYLTTDQVRSMAPIVVNESR